jgi:hypothetical protein
VEANPKFFALGVMLFEPRSPAEKDGKNRGFTAMKPAL